MLTHTVVFWLKPELTAAQRADFRRGVESLGTIKSVDRIYVGTPAGTERRAITDHSFDLLLIVVCQDLAAHHAYQVDPIHDVFRNNFKNFWSRIQIFDAE